MPDEERKFSNRVPWADHTKPSSGGDAHEADKHPKIDPDEIEDAEASPGRGSASDEGGNDVPQADGADSREGYGEGDV